MRHEFVRTGNNARVPEGPYPSSDSAASLQQARRYHKVRKAPGNAPFVPFRAQRISHTNAFPIRIPSIRINIPPTTMVSRFLKVMVKISSMMAN